MKVDTCEVLRRLIVILGLYYEGRSKRTAQVQVTDLAKRL
jgi:hypothetical protein